MPRYFFDIKDGHRLVDPAGRECKNDIAAKEMARVLAVGFSLDTPAVDPTRYISVINDASTSKAASACPPSWGRFFRAVAIGYWPN
jgi:hypothetical protein